MVLKSALRTMECYLVPAETSSYRPCTLWVPTLSPTFSPFTPLHFFALTLSFLSPIHFFVLFFLTSFYIYGFTFISWLFWAIPRLWGHIPEQWSDLFGSIQVTACLKLQERLWWVQPAAFSAESNASPYGSSESHRHFSVCT